MKNGKLVALTLLALGIWNSPPTNAEPMFGVTSTNALIRFDSDLPGTIQSSTAITGLQSGETILGIDFRPSSNQLYGLGSTDRLYTLNLDTAVATQVGTTAFSSNVLGTNPGFDFNPVSDTARVVTALDASMRVNPSTGALASDDTTLAFATGDPNLSADPTITCVAYNNNFVGASTTTLFGIDSVLNALVTVGGEAGSPSPNGGQLFTQGTIGFDTSDNCGFDISNFSGDAFLALSTSTDSASNLFTLDFGTGNSLTYRGVIGSGILVKDISVPLYEATAPTVTVTSPTRTRVRTRSRRVTITGTASDNLQVKSVVYRTVRGSRTTEFTPVTTGTTTWSITNLPLNTGNTIVQVKAIDIYGNESTLAAVQYTRQASLSRLRKLKASRR